MSVRARRIGSLLVVAAGVFSVTGCTQVKELQQVFAHRPSEDMPAYKQVDVVMHDQHWSANQRAWFYHTPQGTELLPYKWYLALEQPKVRLFGTVPKFSDPAYLARFGFLTDAASATNPGGLPVGFAVDTVVDPESGETVQVVGLTCAACHTGQLDYQGKGVRIDGGTAGADLASFQTELGYAVAFTDKIPFRFDRFARAVLGENASSEDKKKLKTDFEKVLNAGLAESDAATKGNLYASMGGFGRTDALGRIGNYVFGTELDNANLRVADAPVKFPPLWYTSWFDWVQYNASIQQPMVRNIGEALGVRARVNLVDPGKLYQSTVNVSNIWKMEEQLAGPTAFEGLKPPAWPSEVFGAIDQAKAQKGAVLYKQRCERCHMPEVKSAEIQDNQYWEAGLAGKRFLKLNVVPLEVIGTDPREATNWAQRTAVTDKLGLGTVAATDGLRVVTTKIRDINYDAMKLTPEQRMEWNGYRADGVAAPLGYRARPLEGLWATPPFLHNGSVPNLYQLLLPADQRDKTFYVGSREFDPKNVGFTTAKFDGGFLFDTSTAGNSNAGHEFRNGSGKGVIGPELSDDERWAIIEYLKTM